MGCEPQGPDRPRGLLAIQQLSQDLGFGGAAPGAAAPGGVGETEKKKKKRLRGKKREREGEREREIESHVEIQPMELERYQLRPKIQTPQDQIQEKKRGDKQLELRSNRGEQRFRRRRSFPEEDQIKYIHRKCPGLLTRHGIKQGNYKEKEPQPRFGTSVCTVSSPSFCPPHVKLASEKSTSHPELSPRLHPAGRDIAGVGYFGAASKNLRANGARSTSPSCPQIGDLAPGELRSRDSGRRTSQRAQVGQQLEREGQTSQALGTPAEAREQIQGQLQQQRRTRERQGREGRQRRTGREDRGDGAILVEDTSSASPAPPDRGINPWPGLLLMREFNCMNLWAAAWTLAGYL